MSMVWDEITTSPVYKKRNATYLGIKDPLYQAVLTYFPSSGNTYQHCFPISTVLGGHSLTPFSLQMKLLLTPGTSSPQSMMSLISLLLSDDDVNSCWRRSPVDRCVNPYFCANCAHWVPLPEPGPPSWGGKQHRVRKRNCRELNNWPFYESLQLGKCNENNMTSWSDWPSSTQLVS